MISVADGWQHGPSVDKGARWEPAEVGAAVHELLAKAPAPGAGLRRAVTADRDTPTRPPTSGRAGARGGIWTDETLLDRLAAADADAPRDRRRRRPADDRRPARAVDARRGRGCWQRGVRPGDVVAWQLPNWWEAVVFCWAIWRCGAIASPITPTLRRARGRLHPRADAARVDRRARATFRGTDYLALVRAAGFDGDVIVVRDGARSRLARRARARRSRRVDDAAP